MADEDGEEAEIRKSHAPSLWRGGGYSQMRHGEKKKGELLEDDLDCLLQESKDMQPIASTDFSALCFRLDTKKTKANLLTRRYRHFSLDKAKKNELQTDSNYLHSFQ